MTGENDPAEMSEYRRDSHIWKAQVRATWSSHMAEYYGSKDVGDVVAQLRRRARTANRRALWVLGTLIIAVLIGLSAYIAWPVVRQFVDGQRAELLRTLDANQAAINELNKDRNDQIAKLSETISRFGEGIETGADSNLNGLVNLNDDAVLIYGSSGTLLSIDKDSGRAETLETGVDADLWGHNELNEDAVLIYGSSGTLLRIDKDSGRAETLETGVENTLRNHAELKDGTLLIYGHEGTLLRIDKDGGRVETLETGVGITLRNHAELKDGTLLIYGHEGTLLRIDKDSGKAGTLETGVEADLWNHTELNDGTVLIYGISGTLLRIDKDGGRVETLETGVEANLWGHNELSDDVLLIYGSSGTLLRFDNDGGKVETLETGFDADLWDHAELNDDVVLIYGSSGTLLRFDKDGGKVETIETGVEANLIRHAELSDGTVAIYGGDLLATNGTLLRFDKDSGKVETAAARLEGLLSGHAELKDGTVFVFGLAGTVVQFPGRLAQDLEQKMGLPSSATEADKDAALNEFIGNRLKKHDFPEKLAASNAINATIAQRSELEKRRTETERVLDEDLPSGAYFLQQQRQSFRQFMEDCRGVLPVEVEPSDAGATLLPTPVPADGMASGADEVTLACTSAWNKKLETEAGNWWQTLAQQIPPGVLLLFLLATLGGLYRYNLRLAGFHASRADLLELLSMQHKGKTHPFQDIDKETFLRLTDAMAADKVDFGKGNMPTDQAVAMAQAFLNR